MDIESTKNYLIGLLNKENPKFEIIVNAINQELTDEAVVQAKRFVDNFVNNPDEHKIYIEDLKLNDCLYIKLNSTLQIFLN